MSRDSWTTPAWLTELIGPVDLDPCSNERSTVQTLRGRFCGGGTEADDGLLQGVKWFEAWPDSFKRLRTYVNPPYSRGQVIRWVSAYWESDFIFCLRWDPSTEWFRRLMERTQYVWFADRRIDFQPPPDVDASSNPFPHALFFRNQPASRFYDAGEVLCRHKLIGAQSVLTGSSHPATEG